MFTACHPLSSEHKEKERRQLETLTKGVPLVLADRLGDVVGEVLGNCR